MPSLSTCLGLWPCLTTVLGNGYFFVITTTILVMFLMGVCLVFKYTPHLMTDLRNLSNREIPEIGLRLWVAFILVLPVFFGAGPLLFTLWWFIVFWVYMNRAERPIGYVLLAVILMSGWIAHVGAGFITYADNQLNREIFCTEHGIGDTRDTLEIAAWVQQHPADGEAMNALAQLEIAKGNYTQAVELLRRSLDLEPNNPRYYNHLGIALAGLGKDDKAIQAFRNSATLDPDTMVYHYNLSRLYQDLFNFHEAEQSIACASSIDPARVRALLDSESRDTAQRYVTQHMPVFQQISRQMHQSPALAEVADTLWKIGLGILTRGWAILIALAGLLVLVILSHLPNEKFTKRCSRCGNLYYAGTLSKLGMPICLQCHWIDTKAKKHMNHILQGKVEDVREYRGSISTQTTRLELMLPGLGALIGNKTGLALGRFTLLSAAAVMIITGGRFITAFIPQEGDPAVFVRVIGLVLGALVFWRAYKSPPVRYGG